MSLTERQHRGVSMCFCVQAKMNRSESQKARRGQAKSTEAAWEVLECRDCDIMFSRPDNSFFSSSFSHTHVYGQGVSLVVGTVKPFVVIMWQYE